MNEPAQNKNMVGGNVPRIPAAILRDAGQKKWQQILNKYPKHRAELELIMRHDLRWLEPWPDWVLNVATELCAVRYPRIQRETIFQCLKALHSLCFGLPVEFPKMESDSVASFLGHFTAHAEKEFAEIKDEKLKKISRSRKISKVFRTQLKSIVYGISKDRENEIADAWGKILKAFAELNESATDVMEKVTDAKRATFDNQGELHTTSATKIYQAIFDDWQDVESMSGLKELTIFLDSHLGAVRSETQKYDLVKKLCGRIGLQF
jgi:hypothetical protein